MIRLVEVLVWFRGSRGIFTMQYQEDLDPGKFQRADLKLQRSKNSSPHGNPNPTRNINWTLYIWWMDWWKNVKAVFRDFLQPSKIFQSLFTN